MLNAAFWTTKASYCRCVVGAEKRLTWIDVHDWVCACVQRGVMLGRIVEERFIFVSFMATVKLQA